MKPTHILITALLLTALLCAAPVAADAVTHNGKIYTTYDQIYASTSLSSSEKLALVQEMAGWTPELEAYMEWKNSGGNSTSSDYGWDEAPGDGLGDSGNIEPEYSYQERQAYDAAYAAYQAEFAAGYDYARATGASGSGTEADPYLISSADDLLSIIHTNTYTYYKQTQDIIIPSTATTSPNLNFYGYYDGSGFKIDFINVNPSSDYWNFYNLDDGTRYSSNDFTITNVHFTNFNAKSYAIIMGTATGGGVYGTVSNCLLSNINILPYSISSGIIRVKNIENVLIYDSSLSTSGTNTWGNTFYIGGLVTSSPNWGAQSNWKVINSVVLTDSVTTVSSATPMYRIGWAGTMSNNYANAAMTLGGSIPTANIGANTYNGASITAAEYNSESWWKTTMSMWDWDNIWQWNSQTNLPELRTATNQAVPPTISTVSVSPAVGGQETTYTLSTSATTTGQGGISGYQWYGRIGSSGSWQAINGATSTTYTFVPGSYAVGDFWFKVVVTGADGGVTDSYDAGFTNVKATVVLAPQITSPAATPAEGPLTQTVQLSASVTSTETATYQWEEQISGSWQAISGATSANSAVSVSDSAATTHSYRLAATNIGGTAYSSTVTYQSVAPPTFSAVSASPSQGTYTSTVQLSATVSGSDSLQWQELVGSSWQNINGATSAVYSLTLTDTAATLHSYRLAATNIGGTAYSSTVTYQSVAPPVFSAFQVSPLSGGVPLSVYFSATASDTSGYRWEYSTDGNIWVQMASGASGSYTFTAEGVYYIRVIATGTGGSTTSASATVTASLLLPEFTQISASPTSGVAPFAVTLSASATNDATFVWQMQSGSSWVQIGSGSPLTYTIPSGTSAGMVYFRAVATNQYGSTTSQTLAVEVGAAPAAEIASPAPGAVFGSNRLISFAAADAGAGVTYTWDFGDGQTGSGRTVTHSYSENGFFMVTLTASSQFGSSEDVVRIEIVEASGDIWLANTDVSSSGVTLQATIEVSPVDAGTLVWFELESMSGQSVYKSPQMQYSGPVSYTASGLPLLAGQTYRATAYSNYYGYSIPVQVTLVDAVQAPHETLGIAWNNGLNREPFNVSALVAAGVGVYGEALGGGSTGAAVSFGVIAMFVIVGLWLRQQDIVVPLTLVFIAGWFVIGNLPGTIPGMDIGWKDMAYTLMVVCVVAVFFNLFRKRIE